MKTHAKFIATWFASCLAGLAMAQTSMDYNILIEDIEFQPGVTIDINVNVYVNENANVWADHGKIVAIEGMAHTANCWKPFAEELFLSGPNSAHLNEFFAVDMPGRGGSGFPQGWNPVSGTNFKLADMYLEDYQVVIQGVISYLNEELEVYPKTIMGHSLGGLEVILLQDKLVSYGTNLREMYQIKNAILLAPAIPAPLTWSFLGAGGAGQLIPFAVESPDHGWILNLPYPLWPWLFFTNTCCYFPPGNPYGYPPEMVPGAPTPAEVLENGYNSIEAAPLLFHMAGLPFAILDPTSHHPTRPRVSANANIFTPDNGVQLTIIADEFDKMMSPAEEIELYKYLTGDNKTRKFLVVEGEETCHDTHISDPHAIVALLNNPNFFKSAEVKEINPSGQELNIHPNPASGTVSISFYLDEDAHVTISVYDLTGREIATLANRFVPSGDYSMTADLHFLNKGIYLLRLETGAEHQTARIVKQ